MINTEAPVRGRAFSTLGCSGASLDEVLRIAADGNCTGVELRAAADEFLNIATPTSERTEINRRLDAEGIVVLSIASYVRLGRADPAGGGSVAEDLAAHLQLAADLGAGGVRVFMGDDETVDHGLSAAEELALDRLAADSSACEDLGVSVLIETHDSHSSGRRLANFMQAVDERIPDHFVGVIWDAAHSWAQGESPAESLQLLEPWLAYLQIKDVTTTDQPVHPGAGDFPVGQLMEALAGQDSSYWVSLEWERKWHPELVPLPAALTATWEWLRANGVAGRSRPD